MYVGEAVGSSDKFVHKYVGIAKGFRVGERDGLNGCDSVVGNGVGS